MTKKRKSLKFARPFPVSAWYVIKESQQSFRNNQKADKANPHRKFILMSKDKGRERNPSLCGAAFLQHIYLAEIVS